ERTAAIAPITLSGVRALFTPGFARPLILLAGTYGIWNLYAGTNGFFFPYILRTVGAQTQAQALALQASGFILAMITGVFVFMRFVDRGNQRRLFALGITLQAAAVLALALF